jgi:phosphatidylglycerol:prolipoprotein diacylglycerol transferase
MGPAFGRSVSGAASGIPQPSAAAGAEVVEPEAIVVSHWFDSGEVGEPYSATIRLTGRRVGVEGRPQPGDAFVHEESIEQVVPASGPVSVSSKVYGLRPGEWSVEGEVIRSGGGTDGRRAGRMHAEPLKRARWSWRRWAVETGPATAVPTRWALTAPLARIPAVIPGIYPALFAVGVLIALLTQAAILASEEIALPRSLLVSLLALAIGLLGAKLWYAVLHPHESLLKGGWAVDGFLVVAPLVAVTALLVLSLPVGAYLDASAPGLFFAVAIGRLGCFLTGCCAGRCTASRWGVWSSDRRVGARRIPTQLLESAAGLLIGAVAVPLVLLHFRAVHGAVFILAFAVYLAVRQLLLRLRAESRRYSWRRSRLEHARS